MNLIRDAWIPVRRRSGIKEKIAPWQLTDRYAEDPVTELAAVRPDFNGALIQFLIGLLQTTCAPKGNSDWRKWLRKPPSSEELRMGFVSIDSAFNLDGDGPRFMQDLTIENEEKKTVEAVGKLLVDAPGDQTLKQNKDLFVKRDCINQLCLVCIAQSLLTLQINAPAGGKGHRVGLRGGGPVSTLVSGENVWQSVWSNVLGENEFATMAAMDKMADADKFPWLHRARTSEKDRATTGQDIHPAQIYWATPRRIRLIISEERGVCDLCQDNGRVVMKYYTKPYGMKYTGLIHPLSPTYKKDGEILSVHQHEPLGYKHWLGFVQSIEGGNDPARIIKVALNRQMGDFRIWAFGYDMDNMKACCWYEGSMPVIVIDNEQHWRMYNAHVITIIRAAEAVSNVLATAVTKAVSASMFSLVKQRFWQETEAQFYRYMGQLRDTTIKGGEGMEVRQGWYGYLVRKSEEIFNNMSQSEMIDIVNAKRVSRAWNELRKFLYGKKLRQEIFGFLNSKEG